MEDKVQELIEPEKSKILQDETLLQSSIVRKQSEIIESQLPEQELQTN